MLDRTIFYDLKRFDPASLAFAELAEQSRQEGFWMLVRLADGWASGSNRFAGRGEALLGAWRRGELAGVCGLNTDPYVERRREGRVRHLYVRETHRRNGVGRLLVGTMIDKARKHFPVLNVRAPAEAFPFYEALGFERVEDCTSATHRLQLRPARRRKED